MTFVVWKAFFSIQNIKKTMFAGWICPKTSLEKNGHFWPKTMDFGKFRFFGIFLELDFSCLNSILFYREHQKWSSLIRFAQKPQIRKITILAKDHGLFIDFLGGVFKSCLFLSKKHSFLSRISKSDLSWQDFPKNIKWEKWPVSAKTMN